MRRGNDGLFWWQRKRLARQWRRTYGRKPTSSEVDSFWQIGVPVARHPERTVRMYKTARGFVALHVGWSPGGFNIQLGRYVFTTEPY